jgi:hypothetical protein
MIQVDVTLRGPRGVGEGVEAGKGERRCWTYSDFPHPVDVSTPRAKEIFLAHIWSNIHKSVIDLDVISVYGITITRILDIRQVYPTQM